MPVDLSVDVFEAAGGAAVADAQVMGGPVGHLSSLRFVPPSPYTNGNVYLTTVTGYDPAWEFSVVRGGDRLTGVVVTGPSYPSIEFLTWSSTAAVEWSPSGEVNVTSSACATALNDPTGLDYWCAAGGDDGSLSLSSADGQTTATFPERGVTYQVQLVLASTMHVGSQGGTGSVSVVVEADHTVTMRY